MSNPGRNDEFFEGPAWRRRSGPASSRRRSGRDRAVTLIELVGVGKTYATGAHRGRGAARGSTLRIERRRVRRDRRPVGLGQVDADAHPRLPRRRRRAGTLPARRRGRRRHAREDQLAEVRNRRIGFVFQQFNLLAQPDGAGATSSCRWSTPASTAAERRERALAGARRRSGSPTAPSTGPVSSPAASSSGSAIARALVTEPGAAPGRRADRQPRLGLDRRRAGPVRRPARSGRTIVLITHEHDVAAAPERSRSGSDDGQLCVADRGSGSR